MRDSRRNMNGHDDLNLLRECEAAYSALHCQYSMLKDYCVRQQPGWGVVKTKPGRYKKYTCLHSALILKEAQHFILIFNNLNE